MPDAKDEIDPEPTHAPPLGARWSVTDTVLLVVLSLLGMGLRLLAIEQWSFGVVEAETFRAVTQPLSGGSDGFTASDQSSFPVGFLLIRWLLDVGVLPAYGEGWIRLPFAFLGCLLVPAIAMFARPMFGRGVAGLSALVIAVHPGHIAASQTANPIVFAMTFAVIAGAMRISGMRRVAFALVVLAGGCHPIGWLCGVGALCAAGSGRWLGQIPRFVWWLMLLHVIVLVPCLFDLVGLSLSILAVIAVLIRPPGEPDPQGPSANVLGLAMFALAPLLAGGVWWWVDGAGVASAGVASASIAALAPLAVLASCSVVQFFRRLRDRLNALEAHGKWLRRLLVATPAIMLLGELATGAFLYFVVFAGARPPWREVGDAVLHATTAGHKVELIAGRGCDVLRVYLRPLHWREPDTGRGNRDPNPGVRVTPLPLDLEAAQQLLSRPDAMLVLQRDEWQAMLRSPEGRELVADFAPVEVWPSPQLLGDQSLYLLRRRRAN